MIDKHILYLSYDGLTDPLGQSQILPYLLGLEQKGYQFTIISFEKVNRFNESEARICQLILNRKIEWVPMRYHKKPPILSTLFDIWAMRKAAKKVMISKQVHLVHCRSYIAGLIGMWLKQKWGIKFLFDIRGFWADERVDGGLWNLSNPIYRVIFNYFKRKEIAMMDSANHIISLTRAGKKEIVSGRLFGKGSAGIEEGKVTVIPCAVDLDMFNNKVIHEQRLQQIRRKIGVSKNAKIMIYLGSLGTWYLLHDMLLFFKKWIEIDSGFQLLFVTKDDRLEIIEKAKQLDVPVEQLIITSSERGDVPYYIANADIGIFFIKPAYSKKASSATKMGEMLAMGLPIITNEGVGDSNFFCGMLKGSIRCINLSHYDIRQIYQHHLQNKTNCSDNSMIARKYFSLDSGVLKYFEVYQNLYSLSD